MSRSRRPSSREQRRAPIIYPSFPLPSLSAHAAHEWPRSGAPASLDDCCIALARPTRRVCLLPAASSVTHTRDRLARRAGRDVLSTAGRRERPKGTQSGST
eukprot:COSAG03_NODE_997_length_5056_cov_64.601369_3_plen_101_part_00